jgi:myo-inositol 2-dehydrogenase / D-chiro-inositol 1-dehydrogenase
MTRLATIGCGEHATGSHGPALALYAARHPGTELLACCDLDPGKAERYRARFGFARAYTDLRRMLDTERPDAVSLVAPIERTCELACAILEWGFPLLMEKPPGRTAAEVDRMIAAAGGVAHQVAFNRRFAPLLRELKREIDAHVAPAEVQHVRYEMTRVGRREPDFSTTAIHGIDAVRFLAGTDYAEVRFRYQALPAAGPGVANVFLDAMMASGASAQLAFCPMAGAVVERAVVHGRDHTFYAYVPMWDAFDAPGRLQHVEKGEIKRDAKGDELADSPEPFVHGGFYGEYVAFLDALRSDRPPSPGLREARQSVAVAECIRERKGEYRA